MPSIYNNIHKNRHQTKNLDSYHPFIFTCNNAFVEKKKKEKRMGNTNNFHKALFVLLALHFCMVNVFGEKKVHVRVVNRLGRGQSMALHCRSKEDDLGNVVLGEEQEAEWRFSVNFFGTTLFYCAVRWRGSDGWYAFDAYNARRDHARCRSECRWMISKEGTLYGYDEEVGKGVLFPLTRMI